MSRKSAPTDHESPIGKTQISPVPPYDIAGELAGLPEDVRREFMNALGNYAIFVPEYDEPIHTIEGKEISYGRTRRADHELQLLTHDRHGTRLPENKILTNVRAITQRLRAKVAQLHSNKIWLDRMEAHEEAEDVRLADEQNSAAREGKPGDLRRLMRQRFVASTPDSFAAAPRTRHKMAEEILVSPTERIIYKLDSEEVKQGDLSGLVIDPGKVKPTLLTNLGLTEFTPPRRATYQKKLELQTKAVKPIKKAIGGLAPLSLEQRGPYGDRYMRTFASQDGYILGTTHAGSSKQLFRADLVDARNRIAHIHEGYEDEIPRLIKIRQVVAGVDRKVGEEWSKISSPEELAKIKAELLELVNDLWLVNNTLKVQIRKLLADCLTLESTFKRKVRGDDGRMKEEVVTRMNPGAKRAKWNLVPGKIDERIREISRIERYLAEDEVRLQAKKAAHDRIPFGEMYLYICERAEANRQKTDKPKPRTLDIEEVSELRGRLEEWKKRFQSRDKHGFLEPYRSFAEKVVAAISHAESELSEEQVSRRKVAEAVLQIFLVLKLQTFWTQIQSIYDKHLASRDLPYFVEVRNELIILFQHLRYKKIAGQVKVPEFDDIYHKLYKLLGELINLAQQGRIATRGDKDKQAAWKVKGDMHRLVADMDIVALVKTLNI